MRNLLAATAGLMWVDLAAYFLLYQPVLLGSISGTAALGLVCLSAAWWMQEDGDKMRAQWLELSFDARERNSVIGAGWLLWTLLMACVPIVYGLLYAPEIPAAELPPRTGAGLAALWLVMHSALLLSDRHLPGLALTPYQTTKPREVVEVDCLV